MHKGERLLKYLTSNVPGISLRTDIRCYFPLVSLDLSVSCERVFW
jgi:hypothetical protein